MTADEEFEAALVATLRFADAWRTRTTAYANSAKPQSLHVVRVPDGEHESLTESQLRAVLDELGRLRAERAALGDGEIQQRIVTPSGHAYAPFERDLVLCDYWLPGTRLEQRTIYGTAWTEVNPKQPDRNALLDPLCVGDAMADAAMQQGKPGGAL